jgi:hypothetical protein
MPCLYQLRSQLSVIIDLPVEHDLDGLVFIANRLVPTRKVDNAETPHAKRDAGSYMVACVVWTPVDYGVTHSPKVCQTTLGTALAAYISRYSTHLSVPALMLKGCGQKR